MISFRIGTHRFHCRAAAVIFDAGHLLLHRLKGDPFWALPGGRLNAGEQGREALQREFIEELGLAVTCGPLVCTGENFFEYRGEPHHEIGLYYSVSLPPGTRVSDKKVAHFGIEGEHRLEFKWFALGSLPALDIRPAVLKEHLKKGSLPDHFVQRS